MRTALPETLTTQVTLTAAAVVVTCDLTRNSFPAWRPAAARLTLPSPTVGGGGGGGGGGAVVVVVVVVGGGGAATSEKVHTAVPSGASSRAVTEPSAAICSPET